MLVAGGCDGSTRHTTAEILDIDAMAFSPGPVISLGRSQCAVVSLPGLIIFIGGHHGRATVNTTEAPSLQTMYFAAGPTVLTPRQGCAALVLPQDHSPRRAFVMGGHRGTSSLFTTNVPTAAD